MSCAHKCTATALLLGLLTIAGTTKAEPPAGPQGHGATAQLRNASLHNRLSSTTALTVASSDAGQGTAVTLMATVDGQSGANPAGTVIFTVEGKQVGEVPMNHGSAALTVSDLPSGKTSLSAVYKGDDNFLPSKSATIHYFRDADE